MNKKIGLNLEYNDKQSVYIGMGYNQLLKVLNRLSKSGEKISSVTNKDSNGYIYTTYTIGDEREIHTNMLNVVDRIVGTSYDELFINDDVCSYDDLDDYGLKKTYIDNEDVSSISIDSLDDIFSMSIYNKDSTKVHKVLRDDNLSINISLFKNNNIINKIILERVFE